MSLIFPTDLFSQLNSEAFLNFLAGSHPVTSSHPFAAPVPALILRNPYGAILSCCHSEFMPAVGVGQV